ncbi:hypothetical protein NQ315_006584 [Exocentrus adspersus]|uniref:Regulatory protein zeste n=1 Tax=Exocentrus adspersus TaxID=1586481 RepID=A0AAV8VFY6_9CUCU|nr:hypothetical protein NQ315_006584 [Exocentrus adspersus]
MDTSEKSKRARSSNFTAKEKEILFSLVMKYKNVVENKKTDQVSVGEKVAAWQKITAEFNAVAPNLCTRSTESLKKFYDNKKKEVRKRVAEEKKEIYATGGGTKKDVPIDSSQDLLLSIINTKTVFGLYNPSDSDNNIHKQNCEENVVEFQLEADVSGTQMSEWDETETEVETAPTENLGTQQGNLENQQGKQQWKKPSSLKSPISSNLKRPGDSRDLQDTPCTSKKTPLSSNRRRPTTTVRALSSSHLSEKYELLMDKRLVIADYEKRKLENDLDMQRVEHNLKVELLKIQIEIEKKNLSRL